MSMRDRVSGLLLLAGLAALAAAVWIPPSALHPVTPSMIAEAGAMTGKRVTSREAVGSDGRAHSPAREAVERPLVLVFIQDGCPCSEAAEPYFQRLQAAYGDRACFLGVIDGDPATARAWAERHQGRYTVLADEAKAIIGESGAERSAYVMLVARGGTIEALWPGYSAGMLAELGARLAQLTGSEQVAIDTAGAPSVMASGCAF